MINRTKLVAVLMAVLMTLSFLPGYAPLLAYADSEENTSEPAAAEATELFEEDAEAAEEPLEEATEESEDIPEEVSEEPDASAEDVVEAPEVMSGEESVQETPVERAPERALKIEQPEEAEQEQPAEELVEEEPESPALRSLAASSPVDTIDLIMHDDFSVPDVEYTPSETGYYELALSARFDVYSSGDGKPIDLGFAFFEDDKYIGYAYLDESNEEGVPAVTLYMQKGKEYRFEINKHNSADATGYIYVSKVDEEDIEEMFTVEEGTLEDYSGNLVNVRIPEGVTNVTTEAYVAMSKNIDWGVISIHYPSTMAEGSITGKDLNYNTGFWDMRYSLNACRYVVSSNCQEYKSIDGVVYSKDGTTLIAVPQCYHGDSLTVSDGVTAIEPCAFGWDGGVETVVLPDSLEVIDEMVFLQSSRLKNIEFGSNLKSVGFMAFDGAGVETLDFPSSLETLERDSFSNCDDLESVTFNSKVQLIDAPFYSCDSLATININDNIIAPSGSFDFCGSITEVNLGKKATEWELRGKALVNNYNEENHPELYDEYLDDDEDYYYDDEEEYEPEKWTKLALVMRDYDSDTFVIDDDIEEVYSEAFYGVNGIKKVTIGKACESVGLAMDLEEIAVKKGNTKYNAENGVLYSTYTDYSYSGGTKCYALEKFPMESDITEFTIPDNITEISDYAFTKYSDHSRKLKKVIVTSKSKLKEIGSGAFSFYVTGWYSEDEVDILTLAGPKDSSLHEYYLDFADYDYLAWETIAGTTYKVTFNANGGTASKTAVTRAANAKIGTLPTASKSGRTFLGWYTKKTGGTKITKDTVVKGNVTYYAHWQCKVTFNANRGKASKTSQKVAEGAAIGTLPTATRSGYFFLGWYTAKSGGTKITTKTTISSNKTYYAHWAKAEIGNATVKVENCTWTGKAQKPKVTVTFKGHTLKKGTDYTVTYSNNKEVGKKAKVVVKGKGVFAKSKKKKTAYFTINKAAQKITASDVTYDVGTKGFKTIKISVKEKAKITLSSGNKDIIKIPTKAADKKKGNIKVIAPGEVKITIKTAATDHYKAGKKTITVVVKGSKRTVKLNSSWLKYDSSAKVYKMTDNVVNKLISVDRGDNAGYKCTIETSGKENDVWVENGNLLTAKGKGDFKIKVVVEKSKAFPAATVYFTIRKSGLALTGVKYLYRQTASGTVDILKYIGNSSVRSLTVGPTIKIAEKYRKITKISDNAFANCEIAKMEFKDPSSGKGITSIGKNAIANNKALTSIRFPSDLETLGDGALKGCTNLMHIKLPAHMKTIGSSAFENCMALQDTLWLPESLTTIGSSAFKGCFGIPRVVFFSYIKDVGANAFSGDTGIKKVYYAASKSRWDQINFGSGNGPVTSLEPVCNIGANVAAYEVSSISTETLLRDAPEFLMNPSYEFVTGSLLDEVRAVLFTKSDWDIGVAALKSEMINGPSYCIKKIIQDVEGTNWDENKLRKDMALELIEEVAGSNEGKEAKDEYTETYHKVYDALGEFKDAGDKIFEDNATRWKVAQKLDGLFQGRQSSEFNDMLETIQGRWKIDKDNPNKVTVEGVYKGAGRAIDAADFLFEVLMLNEYYKVYIDSLLPYLTEGSDLYTGFYELKQQMDQPLSTYAAGLLQESVLKEMTKLVTDGASDAFGFSEGSIKVATVMYQIVGYMIDSPTIDDYNKAWISLSNAMSLGLVFDDVNRIMIENKGGSILELSGDHELITSLYLKAVQKAGDYCCKAMKDPQSVKEMYERFGSSLNYSSYIRSCKENLAASK